MKQPKADAKTSDSPASTDQPHVTAIRLSRRSDPDYGPVFAGFVFPYERRDQGE